MQETLTVNCSCSRLVMLHEVIENCIRYKAVNMLDSSGLSADPDESSLTAGKKSKKFKRERIVSR